MSLLGYRNGLATEGGYLEGDFGVLESHRHAFLGVGIVNGRISLTLAGKEPCLTDKILSEVYEKIDISVRVPSPCAD